MWWLGCYISSSNFKFNFTFPVIYLSCQPQGSFSPSTSHFEVGPLAKFTLLPSGRLLPVMVPCNCVWCIAIYTDCFGFLANIAYHVPSPPPVSSSSSPVFLSLTALLCGFSSSQPGRKLFYSDANPFQKLLDFLCNLSQSIHPSGSACLCFSLLFLNSHHHTA